MKKLVVLKSQVGKSSTEEGLQTEEGKSTSEGEYNPEDINVPM